LFRLVPAHGDTLTIQVSSSIHPCRVGDGDGDDDGNLNGRIGNGNENLNVRENVNAREWAFSTAC